MYVDIFMCACACVHVSQHSAGAVRPELVLEEVEHDA